jgi:hypothetical protein
MLRQLNAPRMPSFPFGENGVLMALLILNGFPECK